MTHQIPNPHATYYVLRDILTSKEEYYPSLRTVVEKLSAKCYAMGNFSYLGYGGYSAATILRRISFFEVYNVNGKRLSVYALVASSFGFVSRTYRSLNASRKRYRLSHSYSYQPAGYVWRKTPVPRTGSWRKGYSQAPVRHKRMFMQAVAFKEEGEPLARAKIHSSKALPDPWSPRPRHIDQCWKSQHKGRKSWNR